MINGKFNGASIPWVNRPLLESAFSSYSYYKDHIEQACSIFRGIAKNHAFSDGNKRTAVAILGTALAELGYFVDPGALSDFTMDVVLHNYDIPEIAAKLRQLLRPLQP